MTLALRKIESFHERQHIPARIDWDDAEAVKALYDDLLSREIKVDADAVAWLAAWRELDAASDEEFSIRHIEMTCDTTNADAEAAFSRFSENIMPVLMEQGQAMKQKVLDTDLLLRRAEAEVPRFLQDLRTDAKLYRKENIDLSTKLRALSQEYQKISGAMTVQWQGEEVTLQAIGREQENTDRSVREQAYRLTADRRKQDRDQLDKLFTQMFELRQQVAGNAGFDNFRDYIFPAKHRYDYSPGECEEFHAAIHRHIVPLAAKLHRLRKERLGLDTLRPWDTSVDLFNEEPHQPFSDVDELVSRCQNVFSNFDAELAAHYKTMVDKGLFDLENRKGKAPGGYQAFLAEVRLPFIFMNAVGVHRDVMTLLHESGHAFHSFLSREQDHFQMHAPMEFCEVASMSMELMASGFLPDIFGEKVAAQLTRQNLLVIPGLLIQVAMVDAFQHWLYTDPRGADADARHAKWLELTRKFLPELDLNGLEDSQRSSWQRILHIFEVPFYYVEYGVAQLGALQFWRNYRKDASATVEDYKRALSAGGALGLKDLFRRANLEWPMSDAAVKPLAGFLEQEIDDYLS